MNNLGWFQQFFSRAEQSYTINVKNPAWPQELVLAEQRGGAALRVAVLLQLAQAQQLLGQSGLQVATLQKAQELCALHSASPDGCAPFLNGYKEAKSHLNPEQCPRPRENARLGQGNMENRMIQ